MKRENEGEAEALIEKPPSTDPNGNWTKTKKDCGARVKLMLLKNHYPYTSLTAAWA